MAADLDRYIPLDWVPFGYLPKRWSDRKLDNPVSWTAYRAALSRLNCVVIDVETGGLDPERNPVLSVGILSVSQGLPCATAEFGVVPFQGAEFTDEALAANGWTGVSTGDLSESAALLAVDAAFELHPAGKRIPLCGHNVHFDAGMLAAMARRAGRHHWPPKFMSHRWYDTCILATVEVLFGRLDGRSLDAMCEAYGLSEELDRAGKGHRSPLADCEATLAVLYELLWRLA